MMKIKLQKEKKTMISVEIEDSLLKKARLACKKSKVTMRQLIEVSLNEMLKK